MAPTIEALARRVQRLEAAGGAGNIPFEERWWLDLASMTPAEIEAEKATVVTMADCERDWWLATEAEEAK